MANAPRQAGSDEYRMGVDDAVAAVCRLIEAETPSSSATPWTNEQPEEPEQTQLAAEYLRLEVTSLLRTIDSILQRPSALQRPDDTEASSLLEAKVHLVKARTALDQAHESVSS